MVDALLLKEFIAKFAALLLLRVCARGPDSGNCLLVPDCQIELWWTAAEQGLHRAHPLGAKEPGFCL